MPHPHLIYLHGFKSSAKSVKAQALKAYAAQRGLSAHVTIPDLNHRPAQALSQIQLYTVGKPIDQLTFVGSSLGGFYATVLAERMGARAVVINPPVTPHQNLESYIGTQTNMYSGESFDFTRQHIDELLAVKPAAITRPERYWLLCATDDDVCDYRASIQFYARATQTVVEGVGHELSNFADYLPRIFEFAGFEH
jgi:uncharacterized protein